jgi:hypothetical protein
MALLGLYSGWIGRHLFTASLFLAFLACCAAVVLYCAFAELSVSAREISQKTLFGRWRFRWEEIGSWTVRACPNSSDDLLFEAGSPPRMLRVSSAAVHEKDMRELKRWFQEYAGDAIGYDAFLARFEKSGK